MIFKDYDTKTLNLLRKQADRIIEIDKTLENISNEELANKTYEFREKIENGESLDTLLEDVFAVCRQATWRILGKRQYNVQLMGGIALHQGRVVEMKTGEGKTLTELCPAYLNALEGKGVHVITVNDYLAQRDKEEMQELFEFLSLSVGLVIEGVENKKEEYNKDITYSTNSELGFDYLRDNLVLDIKQKVQRELNYVIIDEVDSILIDDARTPLIIADRGNEPSNIYKVVATITSKFKDEDYYKNEKESSIYLSEIGVEKVENILGIENLAESKYAHLNHIISQSLRAYFMLEKDKDYIVSEDEIILIDSNTGRIADGRRFSDGLHQSLEAKEGLSVKAEDKTIGSITYQNFFRLYKKMSGMSGTVKTEEAEFREFYNLDVVVIPTNRVIARKDYDDKLFLDNESKIEAIVQDIIETTKTKRPILVGTSSIEKSEELSDVLNKRGINHKLLNAKTKKDEADIIRAAGEKGSITIATNIAGRGTDIKISDEVNALGGLKVIGAERTESRRIDNQLIGRAGRQGDNGESQFYISCDDKLLDIYGEGKLRIKLEKMGFSKGEVIEHKLVRKYVDKAQKIINSMSFDARKETIKYDEVIRGHRETIYKERDLVISDKDIFENISNMLLDAVFEIGVSTYKDVVGYNKDINKKTIFNIYLEEVEFEEFIAKLNKNLNEKLLYECNEWDKIEDKYNLADIVDFITKKLIEYINNAMNVLNFLDQITVKNFLVKAVDTAWIEHLKEMEVLKTIVRDQSYNQKQPIDVYKFESGIKCRELFNNIREMFLLSLFSVIKLNISDVEVEM